MTHEIDQQGNIILIPSTRDIDAIFKSLNTKHVQLRATRADKKSLEEILGLMIVIGKAKADSQRASLKDRAAKIVVPIDSEPKIGWYALLKQVFHPPFTTLDFEEATTVCGLKHFIYSMDFNSSSGPSKVCGEVFYESRWFAVQWSQYGKCSCPSLGPDVNLYNLIRSTDRKMKRRKSTQLAASAWVVTLILHLTIQ